MPGPQELLVIAVVVLLVFGPDRLPEVMRSIAKFIARFREQSERSINELKRAAEVDELNREIESLRREARDVAGVVEREVSGAGREVSSAGRELSGAGREVTGTARDAATQRPGAGAPSDGPPPMDPEAT